MMVPRAGAHIRQSVAVDQMPYTILHVTPYMHASAGGPPVVVENFIAEANRLGHSSEIVSTFAFCGGDESTLRKRLDQLAPATFLTGVETIPIISRSEAEKINAHVRRADIVHVHTLGSPLNVAARYACRRYDKPYVLMPHGMLDPYSLSPKALKKPVYLKFFEVFTWLTRMIYTTSEEGKLAALARLRFRHVKRHHGGLCGADHRRQGQQQRARDCSRSSCISHMVHYAEGHRGSRSGWLTSH
jgi:hypothetical protein